LDELDPSEVREAVRVGGQVGLSDDGYAGKRKPSALTDRAATLLMRHRFD